MKTYLSLFFSGATALALSLALNTASAQVYEWNGSTSSDWATPPNWTEVEDVFGFASGAPAGTAPDPSTVVNILTTTNSPVISSGAQLAEVVNVGIAGGAGQLDITGGSLAIGGDLEIGADNTGAVNINDTNGPVTITIGDDLNLDRDAPAFNSTLVVSGDVTIDVNDRVELGAQGAEISEFFFDFQSGTLRAGDDLRVRGSGAAELRVSSGLIEGADTLDVDSLLTIQGDGVVRVERLTSLSDFSGDVVINDDALLQISVGMADFDQIRSYINTGVFSTSGGGGDILGLEIVSVTNFFGQDLDFFQVRVVPEPSSALVLLGTLSAACIRRSSRK